MGGAGQKRNRGNSHRPFAMLKLIGACLIVVGATGAGGCICTERACRIRQLEALARTFSLIAGEISYSRISLPEIFMETGEKLKEPADFGIGPVLVRIGGRLFDGSGQDIREVWQEEMRMLLSETKLRVQEKELVLSFPDAVWFLDGLRQQTAVTEFARTLQEAAQQAGKRRREEDRITMAFCLACGFLAAILLL